MYGLFFFYNQHLKNQKPKFDIQTVYINQGDWNLLPHWDEFGLFPPLSELRYIGKDKGETVFDVIYSLNRWGLRQEPSHSHKKKSHLFLGGCSYVFGIGTSAEETVTANLRKQMKDVEVINFGFPAGGLQSLIRATEIIPLQELSGAKDGHFVYLFFRDHLNRWNATPSYLHWAKPDHVHYEMQKGSLVSMKLSESDAWKAYQKTKDSGLEAVYEQRLQKGIFDEEEIVSFVRGVKLLKKKYLSLYPKGKFSVALHPFPIEEDVVFLLKKHFDKEQISYFETTHDYMTFLMDGKFEESSFMVPLDGHPNGRFNEFFSELMLRKLGLKTVDQKLK